MKAATNQIVEFRGIDAKAFRDVVFAEYRPAVLRGMVSDWPAVTHSNQSRESIGRYLGACDSGTPVDTLMMAPHLKGRQFYSDDMRGFNFSRSKATITEVTDKLQRYAKFDNRPSLVVQSALIADCLPRFADENRLPVLDPSVQPRIWLGSAVTTPTHFDESNNVACVVAGTRRFTLFPPGQIANLYVGPLGHAPTGTPISLASLANPDFNQFLACARRLRMPSSPCSSRATRSTFLHCGGITSSRSPNTTSSSTTGGRAIRKPSRMRIRRSTACCTAC
jgi:hypothetical protein